MSVIVVVCILVCSSASGGRYDAVGESLKRGELDEAGQALSDALIDDFIDADGFYYHSKLEERGELSVEFLQKSLELCDDDCGMAVAELADAYYAQGQYQDAVSLYKKYKKKVAIIPENLKFFWFAGMSYMKLGEYSSAEKAFKELEKKFKSVHLSGWGALGRASVKAEKGKLKDARSYLRSLVTSGGEASTLAVYNRSYLAARRGDKEFALHGYNILDERFGEFIGSAELAELILMQASNDVGGEAERLVDMTYTIETGIFSDKSEASKLVGKLKAAKWSASLVGRIIGERKYWVVRVGIFRSQQSAQKSKEKLESLFPGNYRVVIR